MKVIKPSVSVLKQEPGILGMYKYIEYCGRVAYKSEDRITEDSYQRFIRMIWKRGHWAVFNLGTVYLKFYEPEGGEVYESLQKTTPWTKWTELDGIVYLTTNYRVICQLGIEDFMTKYWAEPEPEHYHRMGSHWICNRLTSHQLVRHRSLCPLMESQRYCNYTQGKFGGEITFILPPWIYRVREDIGNTIDSLTGSERKYILDLDGEELWDTLTTMDRTVSGRDHLWKAVEIEYNNEILAEDGEKLIPEEARGVLCNDVKTEICLCGYLEDWYYTPPLGSYEKAGFFNLRCAGDAQDDIRILSQDLKNKFDELGYNKLK